MTNKEYVSRRDALLQEQAPYIVMDKNELIAESENFYNIRGVSVMLTPNVQNRLDQLIGLSPRQCEGVKQAYGNDVVKNLRNSFAMANCVAHPKKFALIANAAEYIVDGIVPLDDEAIPMRTFFDIVEILADKYGYEVDQMQASACAAYGMIIRLMPICPQHDAPFSDDEFVTNGLYLKWNLGEIELGNYYLRLICTNGQMQLSENSLERIHKIDDKKITGIINSANSLKLTARNWNSFKNALVTANNTPASVSEVHSGKNLLLRHGAPEDLAEQLMPYIKLLEKYKTKNLHVPAKQAKSNMNMYDLFNRLTDFASHNKLWEQTDNRSSSLMQQSMRLLLRKRDIQTYYDIFS